ncbi:MAPEG family protein [Paracidovorax anthurii]|uniref:Putative MAPEG superfamily protein n=1 Tax=Paracidovorax anthurii TaxID=78229 RepID=A0A328ZM38_9BURK|nr:MAPEG family protein [Paracidovorax anthurii]RAR83917.1 putative MAPEG superfamily protein [Paracidovorax anthurii]WCM91339.1 MAPEG family protein [Acidovorax sp. NCPPB 2350]
MNSLHIARFTVAYWCVFAMVLMPIACAMLAKRGSFRGADNHDPRAWAARQSDWRGRVIAAQANTFECLPFFIGAVIVAHQLGAAQTLLDLLALAFVMLRGFYVLMYVSDMPTARSAVWLGAFMVNTAIFFLGYR